MVTGDAIYGDEQYEHLQIDAVAQFLLFLVEMIESGLQVDTIRFYQFFSIFFGRQKF